MLLTVLWPIQVPGGPTAAIRLGIIVNVLSVCFPNLAGLYVNFAKQLILQYLLLGSPINTALPR